MKQLNIEKFTPSVRKNLAKNSLDKARLLLVDNDNLATVFEELLSAKRCLTGLNDTVNELALVDHLLILTRYHALKKAEALPESEKDTSASIFNLTKSSLNEEERNQPAVTVASLNEAVCNPDTPLDGKKITAAIYHELIKEFFIPTFTLELEECGNDKEKLNTLINKINENEKNVSPSLLEQLRKIKIKCLDKKLAVFTQEFTDAEFTTAEKIYPELLQLSEEILAVKKQFASEDEYLAALNQHFLVQRVFARMLFAHYKNNLTENTTIPINLAKNKTGATLTELLKSLNTNNFGDALKTGKIDLISAKHLAIYLHFISLSYYDLAISADNSERAAHCLNAAVKNANMFLELHTKFDEIKDTNREKYTEIKLLKEKIEKITHPKSRLFDLITKFKAAKESNDYVNVVKIGEDLLEILLEEGNPNPENEELSIYHVLITLANSCLNHPQYDDETKRASAIKYYKRARNVAPLKADHEAKLITLLEEQLSLHAEDHLRRFISDDLKMIRSKMRSSMASSNATTSPEASPTASSAPTHPLAPVAPVSFLALLEQLARNEYGVQTFIFYKNNFENNPDCREALLKLILSKSDEELKRFNPDTLHDVAAGIVNKKYILPAKVVRGDILEKLFTIAAEHPHLAAAANYFLGDSYNRLFQHAKAKACYEKAVVAFPDAHLSLSYICTLENDYDAAKAHLNAILSHQQSSPALKGKATKNLSRIHALHELNKNTPQTPQTPSSSTTNRLAKRKPIIFFDIDNTIFRTSGIDGRFFCNEKNDRIAPENANVADYYINGPEAWTEIFNELISIGFEIGLCTAKLTIAKKIDPLYNDLLVRFPTIFKDNPYIIFTDGKAKHLPLVELCRNYGFNRTTRGHCILVDDMIEQADGARAKGLTTIHVPHLAASTNSETFTAFREHLLKKAREQVALFNAISIEESAGLSSESESEEEEGEVVVANTTTASTASTSTTAAVLTSFSSQTNPPAEKRKAPETPAFSPRARTSEAQTTAAAASTTTAITTPPPRRVSSNLAKRSFSAASRGGDDDFVQPPANTIQLGNINNTAAKRREASSSNGTYKP